MHFLDTETVLRIQELRHAARRPCSRFGTNIQWLFKPEFVLNRAPPTVVWEEYPSDMSQQLLLAACEQAKRSATAVRAAALMHIARVLACSDQAAAEQLLEQGIELAKEAGG